MNGKDGNITIGVTAAHKMLPSCSYILFWRKQNKVTCVNLEWHNTCNHYLTWTV